MVFSPLAFLEWSCPVVILSEAKNLAFQRPSVDVDRKGHGLPRIELMRRRLGMKKSWVVFTVLMCFSLLAGPALSWEGRMAGMGNPTGLIADESDYLVHPAALADGTGADFYASYGLTYTDIQKADWKNELKPYPYHFSYSPDGDQWEHRASLGTAFTLPKGRMAIFLEYVNKRGELEGNDQLVTGDPDQDDIRDDYEIDNDLRNLSLRLLYAVPVSPRVKLGGEVELAYRSEENRIDGNYPGTPYSYRNYILPIPHWNLFQDKYLYTRPCDATYMQAAFKGSVEANAGPAEVLFTGRYGFIFASDSELELLNEYPNPLSSPTMDGDVEGYAAGADLWVRYRLRPDITLPFVVRADYSRKEYDGDSDMSLLPSVPYKYEDTEKAFFLEIGGGVEKKIEKGLIAAGLYYDYLSSKSGFDFQIYDSRWMNEPVPKTKEHRLILRAAAEKEVSPVTTLRAGLEVFHGWVDMDFDSRVSLGNDLYRQTTEIDGSRWGAGVSFGASCKAAAMVVEPYLNIAYQKTDLDGDGYISDGISIVTTDNAYERTEWCYGAGLSLKF